MDDVSLYKYFSFDITNHILQIIDHVVMRKNMISFELINQLKIVFIEPFDKNWL